MVHQYKLNGYNIVLDTCSGSVHSVDDVAYDIIAMYKTASREEIVNAVMKKYGDRPDVTRDDVLLCIDDVGTEPASLKVWGNEVSPLVDLLYHRYDRQLFTIITSNLEGDEDIAKRYGVRVADRFVEMFDLIGFDNSSYRPRLTKLTPR